MKITLFEDSNLYRGIFWIPNINNLYDSKLYFQIPCDFEGNISGDFKISTQMSSKGTDNYNHKNVWNTLPKNLTNNKPFNYYPRGRVEINHGTAIIYHSPQIPQDELKSWVIDKFNLTKTNGIKNVKMRADGSAHYKCYLDE